MYKRDSLESKKTVSLRPDVDQDSEELNDQVKQDAQRMDALMRQLLGGAEEEEETREEEEKEEAQEEEFSFRLFANKPLAKVNIVEEEAVDNSQKVLDLQQFEFDETDPDFQARVSQVAVDYMTIMEQSTIPYPTMQLSHNVIHLNDVKNVEKKSKRKSKKCRDFEKRVKAGEIKLQPNMRKPETSGGWPGWPGELTRVSIVNYVSHRKGKSHRGPHNMNSRGGKRGGKGFNPRSA